jgi:hypothetical protein
MPQTVAPEISRHALNVAAAIVAAAALCIDASGTRIQRAPPPRVLFIGNSLTAANNLPGLVAAMSASIGEPLECERVTFDGYSLEDHWHRGEGTSGVNNEGSARRAIARGGWSTVVLQQGPSALPESRVLLVEYARRFDLEIRRVGARTALYMVWPTADRRFDFDGVKASYEAAAKAVGGVFLPVGDALRRASQLDGRLALYGADGFHPTVAGSYLAALVITRQLTGKSIDNVPAALSLAGPPASRVVIPDGEAVVLRRAATQTVK